jgi:putative endonuclease
MSERRYCVYIMSNAHNSVLYTGVTNNLQRRVMEHKSGKGGTFSKKYNVDKLVYFECGDDVNTAIFREKQIKAGSRKKKMDWSTARTLNGRTCTKNILANVIASLREAISQ